MRRTRNRQARSLNPESRVLRPLFQPYPTGERRLQFRADRVDARQDGAYVRSGGLVELGGGRLVAQALPLCLERLDVRRERLELAAFLAPNPESRFFGSRIPEPASRLVSAESRVPSPESRRCLR